MKESQAGVLINKGEVGRGINSAQTMPHVKVSNERGGGQLLGRLAETGTEIDDLSVAGRR